GEMSRFLTQMKYDKEVKVTERILGYKINIDINDPIRIFKTKKTLQVLSEYIINDNKEKRYLSPSALNMYLDCSLKFYFKHVARLKEPDEVVEEIDPMIFGNLLHHSVNLLYKPYEGKVVDLQVIKELINDRNKIRDYVNQSFIEIWSENDNKKIIDLEISGKSMVIRDVLLKYVVTLLKTDLKYTPFRIIELEKNHRLDIPVSLDGKPEKVRVGGRVDRIDMVDGVIRVIDYKTGATENQIKEIRELFKPGDKNRKRAILQTFIYALMLMNKDSDTPVIPGIYSVRDIHDKNFDYRIFIKNGKKSKSPVIDISDFEVAFMDLLKKIIEEIYDTTIPFQQVDDPDICKYCPYKQLCNRNY
ncbi:MAG: PD-(D/E)XK nuclease family protein, partial [Bacteroidales bacterium]|nr:PD-(D/E)XK nuclease family protein [Bacteroidales bacterium]